MRRAEKVARRARRNKDRSRRRTKALMVASTFATAGTTLVAMAMATPAWADYTSPNGFVYHPGLALQAGGALDNPLVTVTAPPGSDPQALFLSNISNRDFSGGGEYIASYGTTGFPLVATGTVPLFALSRVAGETTDCAGESITNSTATFAGCFLKTISTSAFLDVVPVTVAFPDVTQSVTKNSGLFNGNSVFVKTNAQGDIDYAATDAVGVEECSPMPAGVVFDIHSCIGLGNMTPLGVDQGQGDGYMATVPVLDHVGSTTCAPHDLSTSQCSLWTVEVHNDSTGRYWWPLANGIPISFK
jgi:hypothetical protein